MARNGYDFYIDKCLLPVTPSKLQVKINNANKPLTLIDEGEINILRTAALADVEFECLIPQVQYPFATYKSGFKGASYFLDYFEKLKTKKKPFQFIVSRKKPNGSSLFSTNIKVSMENYTIVDDTKTGLDLTVKISLKQYRAYSTKTVEMISPEKEEERTDKGSTEQQPLEAVITKTREAETSPTPSSPTSYTVKSGDCLWTIAKKLYGNGADYKKIAAANPGISSPNLIYPGQTLTIPVTG